MRAKKFIIPILLCTALLIAGCIRNGKQVKGKEVEDSTNVDDTIIDKSDTVSNKPNSATLLFDASGSMHGYLISSSDSRFIGVISSFENIPKNISVRMYGTSEGNSIEKSEFDRMLNNGKIEWSNESDLKAMVRSMINHVDSGDDVCFLITDGILSGSNAAINSSPDKSYNIKMREKMSEDLSAMLGDKIGILSALIVRYNATFNGMYSCYNNEGKKLVNKDRPFFVIALGKWGNLKYIEEKLNETKVQSGITTPYEDMVMIGDSRSYQKIKLSPAEGLNPKDGKLVIKREYRGESIALSADLGELPAYMQTDEYMNANIEVFVQHGQKASKTLDKEYYEATVNNINGKMMLRLCIKSSQLKDSKLTFKLKYALPGWIEVKSDDNDLDIATNPSKLGKTFNLKYFVAGFAALHDGKYIKEQTLDFK